MKLARALTKVGARAPFTAVVHIWCMSGLELCRKRARL
mgnify:FL=1